MFFDIECTQDDRYECKSKYLPGDNNICVYCRKCCGSFQHNLNLCIEIQFASPVCHVTLSPIQRFHVVEKINVHLLDQLLLNYSANNLSWKKTLMPIVIISKDLTVIQYSKRYFTQSTCLLK